MALKLAPKPFYSVKPQLVRVVRIVLEVVAVNAELGHHDASRNTLDKSHEFLDKPPFVRFAVFGEGVARLYHLQHLLARVLIEAVP